MLVLAMYLTVNETPVLQRAISEIVASVLLSYFVSAYDETTSIRFSNREV